MNGDNNNNKDRVKKLPTFMFSKYCYMKLLTLILWKHLFIVATIQVSILAEHGK